MHGPRITRRRSLAGSALTLASALAGCSALRSGRNDPTTTPTYDHLQRTAVYLGPDVSLSLPDGVEQVPAPEDADLVVVDAGTDVGAETATEWLADGRAVALLGDGAQETFLAWTDSEPYRRTFDDRGSAEATPAPDLVVAYARDDDGVSTHRTTWGSSGAPDERAVLSALEEALDGREERAGGD